MPDYSNRDRRTSHIPSILVQKRHCHGSVHGTGVVPNHQITHTLPVNGNNILTLLSMIVQLIKQLLRFLLIKFLNMTNMRGNVKVHPSGFFV